MKIETFEKTIKVEEFIEGYVNVEEFLECCKVCENYEQVWSCPTYDFDPVDYWKRRSRILCRGQEDDPGGGRKENWETLMAEVKADLTDHLYALENNIPRADPSALETAKSAAKVIAREKLANLQVPRKMRYSIESLGGNVGLTASKLLGINLQWIEAGQIPDYFVLVGGLLY